MHACDYVTDWLTDMQWYVYTESVVTWFNLQAGMKEVIQSMRMYMYALLVHDIVCHLGMACIITINNLVLSTMTTYSIVNHA